MSRLGKKPITVPNGVEVKIDNKKISVKGPKGELSREFRNEIAIEFGDKTFKITPRSNSRLAKKLLGTYISLIKNMVQGVTEGFSKRIILEGIGYKAALEGKNLVLALGFSHPVKFFPPEGVLFQIEKNIITVSGADKEKVGETAARLRALKKPDPYKGKGFRYEGEIIRRKAGKKAAGTTA